MMRFLITFALVVLVLLPCEAGGDDNRPPLQEGDSIGVFYVTKVAGAEFDGVQPGAQLCYRCRYGSSPIVLVFARQTGGKVPQLVEKLDTAIAEHEDVRLKAMLTLMGEDMAVLKQQAKQLAADSNIQYVPLVIAKDTKSGPPNYRIPAGVDVAVVVARDSQVVTTHHYDANKIDIATIVDDVQRLIVH